MKILAIDTSTRYLTVALADNDKISAELNSDDSMKHSSLLIPYFDKLLKKHGLELKDIDVIALSIGPGSFAGLRVGVASCKAINMALGIKIVSIPTLDVIAYNFAGEKEKILCPVIDAKKNKVYWSLYASNGEDLNRLSGYMLTEIERVAARINKSALLFGDGAKLYEENLKKNAFIEISKKDWLPKAASVAKLGFEKAKRGKFDNPDKLVPLYLHSQYCQVKGYKE